MDCCRFGKSCVSQVEFQYLFFGSENCSVFQDKGQENIEKVSQFVEERPLVGALKSLSVGTQVNFLFKSSKCELCKFTLSMTLLIEKMSLLGILLFESILDITEVEVYFTTNVLLYY